MKFPRKGSGVEDALHKCDSAFSKAEVNTTQGKVDVFKDAVGKSAPIIANYCSFLEEEIEKAPNKSTSQKALVMLRKTLDAIRYTMESQIGMLTSKLKHEPIKQAVASNFSLSLRAAVARARVFAAMVDLNAAPQTFNHGIVAAARDITQQIGNVDKLRDAGFAVPPGDPAKLFKELTPYAQDKIKMEHYVPLHPQLIEPLSRICNGKKNDVPVFEYNSYSMWIKREKIPLRRCLGHFVLGDLRKFAEQYGDIIHWDQSNRAYVLTHGVSGVDWSHYKHPLPEHVYDGYMQQWGVVCLRDASSSKNNYLR